MVDNQPHSGIAVIINQMKIIVIFGSAESDRTNVSFAQQINAHILAHRTHHDKPVKAPTANEAQIGLVFNLVRTGRDVEIIARDAVSSTTPVRKWLKKDLRNAVPLRAAG